MNLVLYQSSGAEVLISVKCFNSGWKMGHRDPTTRWTSERCFPDAKQGVVKRKNFR